MVEFTDHVVEIDNLRLRMIKEGKTEYFIPDPATYVKKRNYLPTELPVFYNPAMEINRDITLLAIYAYEEIFDEISNYVEALAGTGIRGFRVLNELSKPNRTIIQNDLNPLAYKTMLFNREYFKISAQTMRLENVDANYLLHRLAKHEKMLIDAIEIDPYGSPAPYLSSVFNSIKGRNGLLLITATDTGPLSGKFINSALRKYACILKKNPFPREIAVRTLIFALGKEGTIFSKRFIPLFGIFHRHFVKVVGIVKRGKREADKFWKEIGWVLFDTDPAKFKIWNNIYPPLQKVEYNNIIGPTWIGAIFNQSFLESMLVGLNKLNISSQNYRLLQRILSYEKELPEVPLYYDIHLLAKSLKINPPPIEEILDNVITAGYCASRTHFNPWGIRTDAPIEIIKNILMDIHNRSKNN